MWMVYYLLNYPKHLQIRGLLVIARELKGITTLWEKNCRQNHNQDGTLFVTQITNFQNIIKGDNTYK